LQAWNYETQRPFVGALVVRSTGSTTENEVQIMKDFDVEVLVDAAKTRTGLAQLSHPGIPDIMDNLRAFIDAVNQQGLISDRRGATPLNISLDCWLTAYG